VCLGAVGFAVGSAVGAWVEAVMLSGLLRRSFPSLRTPLQALRPVAVAGAVSFVSIAALKLLANGLPTLISVVVLVGVGGFIYVVACFRTGVEAAVLVLRPARRILWRR